MHTSISQLKLRRSWICSPVKTIFRKQSTSGNIIKECSSNGGGSGISIRQITEDNNFMEAFNLETLAKWTERFVSHPIGSLAQAYVYRNHCQPFGIYKDDTMIGYVMVIYDYDIPEYDIWHMRKRADPLQLYGSWYTSGSAHGIVEGQRTVCHVGCNVC